MRKVLTLVLLFSFAGCAVRGRCLKDNMRDVNSLAFNNKVQVEVKYCDRHENEKCWKHHGLYVPATRQIHIAPEWYWEPQIYQMGIMAHEMIHAWLDQSGQEASESHPHSYIFDQERTRVARALDIPVWAIPNGKREDKLDATRMMAYLESYQQAQIDAVHGLSHRETGGAGWPTELYDPE